MWNEVSTETRRVNHSSPLIIVCHTPLTRRVSVLTSFHAKVLLICGQAARSNLRHLWINRLGNTHRKVT